MAKKLTQKEKDEQIIETIHKLSNEEKIKYAQCTNVSNIVHLALAKEEDLDIKRILAQNESISQEVEEELLKSNDSKVLENLAENKQTAGKTLKKLTKSKELTVLNKLAKREKIDTNLIRKIYQMGRESGVFLRATLLSREECPTDIILEISKEVMKLDPNELVTQKLKKAIKEHNNSTQEIKDLIDTIPL